jgi:retron-type reverse transcriptase
MANWTMTKRAWQVPVRRALITKADGGRWPLGILALEDTIVQGAVAVVLCAAYEVHFLEFSYGCLGLGSS